MAVDFYDVKTRQKVSIDDKNVLKTTFNTSTGGVRYGVRGKTDDGRMLTKFVSKTDWDAMKYDEEKKSDAPKTDAKKAPAAPKKETAAKADTKKKK